MNWLSCSKFLLRQYNKLTSLCAVFAIVASVGCSSGGDDGTTTIIIPPTDTVGLSASTYSVAEDGTSVNITVSRTGAGAGETTVDYATSDGVSSGATAGVDYNASSGTLTWVDGNTDNQIITVNLIDDNQYEGDETVTITLSNVSNGTLGTATATLTITEEDTPGTLAFSATTAGVTETNAAGVQVTLTVNRGIGSDGNVSVSYATADGTAGSTDYTAISGGTLSWIDGETASKTITIDIAGDTETELSENLTVTLSNPQAIFLDSSNDVVTITITDNDSVSVIGTVSAPNADIAFNGPGLLERLFARIIGSATAALSDLVSPVPNATVEVYQVDATGTTVGSVITTATTDSSGNFTLAAPLALTGSESAYIVRATGSSGTLDSRISSTSGLVVDPVTDATSDLVTSITSDLTTVSATEITDITEVVTDVLDNVATSSVTAVDLSTNLQTEIANNEEANNEITSKSMPGIICGQVTDSASAGIENVRIIVRDFGNRVTRAKSKTDSNGDYCLNVPITGDTDPFTGNPLTGEYIIGAINRTGDGVNPLKSASEWYTGSGGARTQFGGSKVTISNNTLVSIDFQLADGARITGTVTTHDGGSAENIKVQIRDYNTFISLATAKVKSDGTYRVSVPDGDYMITAVNKTLGRAYATLIYGANSTYDHAREAAGKNTVTVGQTLTADMTLQAGNMLSGEVLATPGGMPVQGVRVRVNLIGGTNFGGTAARLRTRKNGSYRIWLKPDSYKVQSRGQEISTVNLSAGSVANTNFTAQQGTITGTLQEGSGNNPVSQAKLYLYTVNTTDPASYVYTLVSQELSNSDGTFELYATTGSAYKLLIRMDEPTSYASMVYTSAGGTNTINGGDSISVTTGTETALGMITLPTQGVTGGTGALANGAGILSGIVSTNGTSGIAGGQRIEVRATATNNTARFLRARTRGDGSYSIPLPVSSTYRVRIIGNNGNDGIAIIDGMTTTLNR